MTEALYLEDSYRQSVEATVERSLDDRIALDRTICYPEGGGQPADRGTVTAGEDAEAATWEIVDVQKQDTIYHHLEPMADAEAEVEAETEADEQREAGGDAKAEAEADGDADQPATPPEGATVRVDLDWERRHAHMRHHTAQHLLSRVLIDEFDAGTEGNQLYADGARIDCEQGRFDDEDLATIESRVQELIDDERSVEWYELDRETAEERLDPERTRIELLPDSITEIRIVEIEAFDRTACAGTHVETTGECGVFELTGRESKGDDVERLRFELS